MIAVAHDIEGLRLACCELLEEAMDAPVRERLQRLALMAANSDAVLDSAPQRRTLSPGYYMWIEYLRRAIELPLGAGVAIAEPELAAEDLEGLEALRAGRAEFQRKHPPCRGCGSPLEDSTERMCAECQTAAAAERRS